jgi:hypothetical protein
MHIVTDRDDSEPEVMTSLPRSRPVRRSSKRAERSTAAEDAGGREGSGAPTAKTAKARPRTAAATKPKATAKRGAPSSAAGAARRPPRTTPRPRPAAATRRSTAHAADAVPTVVAAKGPATASPAEGRGATPAAGRTASPRRPTTARTPRARPASAAPPLDPPRGSPERKVPAAGYAAPFERAEEGSSPVTDLVTTTVLAATELAQIGLDVGRAAVRSMFDRLPKP